MRYQLVRLSRGRRTAPNVSPLWALVAAQLEGKRWAKRYRGWITERRASANALPA